MADLENVVTKIQEDNLLEQGWPEDGCEAEPETEQIEKDFLDNSMSQILSEKKASSLKERLKKRKEWLNPATKKVQSFIDDNRKESIITLFILGRKFEITNHIISLPFSVDECELESDECEHYFSDFSPLKVWAVEPSGSETNGDVELSPNEVIREHMMMLWMKPYLDEEDEIYDLTNLDLYNDWLNEVQEMLKFNSDKLMGITIDDGENKRFCLVLGNPFEEIKLIKNFDITLG